MPRHELEVADPAPVAIAVGGFDWFGPMAQAAFPHRHAFHEIVLVSAGTGTHVIELAEHPIRAPQLFVIGPGQVHHWRDARGLAGRVLVFGDEALLAYPEDRALLLGAPRARRLRPRDARAIGGLFAALTREYADRPPGFDTVLPALLHVLVVRTHRLAADREAEPRGRRRDRELATAFAQLLARRAESGPSVGAYAQRLGVSASRLAEAVKAATGEPPGRLIRRAQALEARRLLARTALTVAQVARATGFADPAYFSRFFRREVGLTPGRYREMHQDRGTKSIDFDECDS
ncbi:helix-turn-helix domain-containing protein [Dactylosporangium salmoneum]|uniref:AraC family transcriptional regulator n=1 Tax=Dactylosporangium salmoneum TaxID=53361 RepID=A0ABN3HG28_9ACTN